MCACVGYIYIYIYTHIYSPKQVGLCSLPDGFSDFRAQGCRAFATLPGPPGGSNKVDPLRGFL